MNIEIRPAVASDIEFAFQVKKLAFKKYVEMVWGWDEAEQEEIHTRIFLEQEFHIVSDAGIDVGVIAFVRSPECIRFYQLFLLPEFQRRGIGRKVMERIMEEAKKQLLPIRIQTLKVNQPAQDFAEKLGFNKIGKTAEHIQWEWSSCKADII